MKACSDAFLTGMERRTKANAAPRREIKRKKLLCKLLSVVGSHVVAGDGDGGCTTTATRKRLMDMNNAQLTS